MRIISNFIKNVPAFFRVEWMIWLRVRKLAHNTWKIGALILQITDSQFDKRRNGELRIKS